VVEAKTRKSNDPILLVSQYTLIRRFIYKVTPQINNMLICLTSEKIRKLFISQLNYELEEFLT
jgi:hypothetical protein